MAHSTPSNNHFSHVDLLQELAAGYTERPLFGYNLVAIMYRKNTLGPHIDGQVFEVNDSEAATIRMVFDLFNAGRTMAEIAAILNQKGTGSTRHQKESPWTAAKLEEILSSERYVGEQVIRSIVRVTDPVTGKVVIKVQPKTQRLRIFAAHLRIISQATRARAQEFRDGRKRAA